MGRLNDLTGQHINRWTVLKRDPERKGRTYWLCQCDCDPKGERIKSIESGNLTSGRSKSCGCLNDEMRRARCNDYINKQFFRLTVIEKTDKRGSDGSIIWKCRCGCGTECEVSTNELRNGDKKSCGCQTRNDRKLSAQKKLDLTKQRFGKLIVLERDFESAKWLCECDCGNKTYLRSDQLLSKTNSVQSCHLCNTSKGELKIKELLEQNNLPFVQQKTFQDCINPKTNKQLKFDFYVNNSYLLEYDGIQHFENVDRFKNQLENIQYRDQIKNNYCKKHNIPLIRIPYIKYNTLTLEDILLKEE